MPDIKPLFVVGEHALYNCVLFAGFVIRVLALFSVLRFLPAHRTGALRDSVHRVLQRPTLGQKTQLALSHVKGRTGGKLLCQQVSIKLPHRLIIP